MRIKSVSIILLLICTAVLLLFVSCGDSPTDNQTSEPTSATPVLSGKFQNSVNWRYDPETSIFYFCGTGKIESQNPVSSDDPAGKLLSQAEHICFEEGITDADMYLFWDYYKMKTLTLPSSYTGDLPNTYNIEKFTVADENPKYCSDEFGVVFDKEKSELVRFPRASSFESYDIPEGTKGIADGAFDNAKKLCFVTVPQSMKSVSYSDFKKSGVYVNPSNWEDGILYIGDRLAEVDRDTVAEHIAVREGTRVIESSAFVKCYNIKSITIPDSVEIIGNQAFDSCTSLEKIYIGSGVKEIGIAPFVFEIEGGPCEKLEEIEVSKDNKHFISVDGVLYNKDMTTLIQYPLGKIQDEFVIPDSVTEIDYGALVYANNLKKLIFGKGIPVIDDVLIFGCDNLETVILPDTVTKIDGGAFKFSGIKYIDIPDSVTYLGCEAMTSCHRLETINIGKGVSEIHEWAISGSSLKEINVDPENEYFTSKNGVLYNKDLTELYLYPDSKTDSEFHIPETVVTIKDGAFGNAKNLKKLHIGKNVKKIEINNFYGYIYEDDEPTDTVTPYEIYFYGTEKTWESLFTKKSHPNDIDKSKVHFV